MPSSALSSKQTSPNRATSESALPFDLFKNYAAPVKRVCEDADEVDAVNKKAKCVDEDEEAPKSSYSKIEMILNNGCVSASAMVGPTSAGKVKAARKSTSGVNSKKKLKQLIYENDQQKRAQQEQQMREEHAIKQTGNDAEATKDLCDEMIYDDMANFRTLVDVAVSILERERNEFRD